MQHTEVPRHLNELIKTTRDTSIQGLEHGDQIIYASIRLRMNNITRRCKPYYTTIAKMLKCSTKKISEAVDRLINTGLLKRELIIEPDKKQHYEFYFPESEYDKKFERFTEEFLKLDIPLNIKEYYLTIQPYLLDKTSGMGRCSFSNSIIASKTGWTIPTVKKYNTWLIEHNYMKEFLIDRTDEVGLTVIEKNFDLNMLGQFGLWVKNVNKQVNDNTEDIQDLKAKNEELTKRLEALEKEAALKRNYVPEPSKFSM